MLTYDELIELRDKVLNNEIGVELAKEQCLKDLKEGKRSWHTKDWKKRRKIFIKEKCEICSSMETLTLQHKSHPKKYNEFKREITNAYTNQYINNNTEIDKTKYRNRVLNDYEYVPILLCPDCKSKNPSERVRKIPKYRCGDCKYEFEEAIFRSASELISIFFKDEYAYEVRDKCFISKDRWRNKHNLSNIKYWFQRKIAKNKENVLLAMTCTEWNYARNAMNITREFNIQLVFNVCQKKNEKKQRKKLSSTKKCEKWKKDLELNKGISSSFN